MARRKSAPDPKQNRPEAEVSAERQEMLRRYEAGYIYRKDMRYQPNTALRWFDQVLDLQSQGKPTSAAAYELAIGAKRRADGRKGGKQPVAQTERSLGEDDEELDW